MRSAYRVNEFVISALLAVFVTKVWAIDERVQLKTPTGTLHGTIDLPKGTPPHPLVIIIAGSGATNRGGNQAMAPSTAKTNPVSPGCIASDATSSSAA